MHISFVLAGENNGIAYVTCTRCDFPDEFEGEDVNNMFDDEDYLTSDDESTTDDEI